MFSSKSGNGRDGFTILYRRLGTISTKELLAALIADLKAIQEDYGVAYITGGHLKLYVTDDKGRDVPVRRNRRGGRVLVIDTYHYRPVCKDYEL